MPPLSLRRFEAPQITVTSRKASRKREKQRLKKLLAIQRKL
jgi:hypothetical protein